MKIEAQAVADYRARRTPVKDGRASWVPMHSGRGLTDQERRRIDRAGDEARRRAVELAGPADVVFKVQCGVAAEDVALRCVLARRSMPARLTERELALLDAAFDEAIREAQGVVRGPEAAAVFAERAVEVLRQEIVEAREADGYEPFEPEPFIPEPEESRWWAQHAPAVG